MLNDKQYIQMKSALDKLIKPEEDSIRFYLLCKNCAKNIVISGPEPTLKMKMLSSSKLKKYIKVTPPNLFQLHRSL
jgi:hypothetical protein